MSLKPVVIGELNPPLNVTVVRDSAGLALIRDFFSRVDTFGYDCETNVAEDFTQRKVRTLQVGDRNEQYVIDLLGFAGSLEAMLQQGGCKAPGWAVEVVETLRLGLESSKHLKVGVY